VGKNVLDVRVPCEQGNRTAEMLTPWIRSCTALPPAHTIPSSY
jgi:hypothetical protein